MVYARRFAIYRKRPLFGQRHELTLLFDTGRGMNREIPVVHLVKHDIRRIAHDRAPIILPAFGIGFPHIDDGPLVSIDTYGTGEQARRLFEPFPVMIHPEGIEHPVPVSGEECAPYSV